MGDSGGARRDDGADPQLPQRTSLGRGDEVGKAKRQASVNNLYLSQPKLIVKTPIPYSSAQVDLARFRGRPGELSPKARFMLFAGWLLPARFKYVFTS